MSLNSGFQYLGGLGFIRRSGFQSPLFRITQLKFLDSGTQITLPAWRRRAESDLGLNAFLLSLTDGYGFNVKGGRDKPYQEGDPCVYITRLRPGAAAEKNGLLSPGDRIVEVCDLGNFLYKKSIDCFLITLKYEMNTLCRGYEDCIKKISENLSI